MNRKTFLYVVLALVPTLVLGTTIVIASGGDVHWSYEGDTGPEHWAELSPDFATCGTGTEQSPIDLPSSAPLNPADLTFGYQNSTVNIVNNGHTIQVNYDEGSTMTVDGQTYKLLQFHFHAPSENAVDGNPSAMEMHLVHQNAQGRLAVVGVLLEEGAENPAYAPVLDNMPAEEGEPQTIAGASVSAAELLPGDQTYWRFKGSLTTPPCTEGVKWFVMNNPVQLSAAQIGAYTAIYNRNARPVQAMNDREFIVGQAPDTLPETGANLTQPDPVAPLIAGLVLFAFGVGGLALYRHRSTA